MLFPMLSLLMDNKFLQKRKNTWYIRVPSPPLEWGLGNKEFLASLKTSDIRSARLIRDKYLTPLMAETAAEGMLKSLLKSVSLANENTTQKMSELRAFLDKEKAEKLDLSLKELSDEFINFTHKGDYSPATIKLFTSTMRALNIILGPNTLIRSIDKKKMIMFRDTLLSLRANWLITNNCENINSLKAKDPADVVSPTTVKNYFRRIKTFFNWAISEDFLPAPNPAESIKMPFQKTVIKQVISIAEADQLALLEKPITQSYDETTWKYMPLIARYTGARFAEVAQLTHMDIIHKHDLLCISIIAMVINHLRPLAHSV